MPTLVPIRIEQGTAPADSRWDDVWEMPIHGQASVGRDLKVAGALASILTAILVVLTHLA